ncbi:hypothetical protein ISS30_05155 [bacterium]|nr:hypothetical protein [bacterium]
MRLSIVILFLLLSTAFLGTAAAQSSETLRIGGFYPESIDDGVTFGFHLKRAIDERLDFGFSGDYFGKKYKSDTEIDTGGMTNTVITNFEETIIMIPLFLNLDYKLLLDYPIVPYIGGGAGYTLLWDKYDNYKSPYDEERDFYHGFAWQAYAGTTLQISSKAVLVLEGFYNNSKPSKKEEEDNSGRPVRTEIDVTGYGFRVGIKFTD